MNGNRSFHAQALGYTAWLAFTLIFASAAALASARAGAIYLELDRPPWAPPAWLFTPVWTLLYLLMATGAWLVWLEYGFVRARAALSLFVLQLVANGFWTWLFFVWRLGALAFVEILLLWGLIAATAVAFWRRNRLAGVLLLPYLAWITLACALTFSTWQRNPGVLG